MEHHDVVAAPANVDERVDDFIRILIKVRDEDHETATPQRVREFAKRFVQGRPSGRRLRVACAPLDAVEREEDLSQMLGRRRNVVDDVVVDRRQPDAVALQAGEVRQTRRHVAAVRQLRQPSILRFAAVVHRRRHIEDDDEVGVRLGLEFLQVVPITARPQPPIDTTDVVARHVPAVLGKIRRRPEMGRLVQPVDEPLDHGTREQLEIPDPSENGRVEERTRFVRDRGHAAYIPDFGSGTAARSFSIT